MVHFLAGVLVLDLVGKDHAEEIVVVESVYAVDEIVDFPLPFAL